MRRQSITHNRYWKGINTQWLLQKRVVSQRGRGVMREVRVGTCAVFPRIPRSPVVRVPAERVVALFRFVFQKCRQSLVGGVAHTCPQPGPVVSLVCLLNRGDPVSPVSAPLPLGETEAGRARCLADHTAPERQPGPDPGTCSRHQASVAGTGCLSAGVPTGCVKACGSL